MTKNTPLWTPKPSQKEKTTLMKFMTDCGYEGNGYEDFWEWSTQNIEEFWEKLWDFCDVVGDKGEIILQNPQKMTGGQFFSQGKINYAQNMLRKRDTDLAIIFEGEKGKTTTLTFQELYDQVSLYAQALKGQGVREGDRVAAYMPNTPETIIACLATVSLGAIWSSASPDFGAQGVIDRFGQIEPKILITVDGYFYGGKEIDCLEKIKEVQQAISSLEKTIIIPFVDDAPDIDNLKNTILISEFTKDFEPQDIDFNVVPFNHPLFIMFSSGTTGVPKCIVHGHGGTLLQHLKEHQMQCNVKEGDRIFYFTTCGWMMWNWLVSGLATGATLLLYDGSPFYPNRNILWDFTSKHKATLFGTAAKYIDALNKFKIHPKETHDLVALKTITSTGSPLVHESFDFVYSKIKKDVHLASISGGTDIVSCFMLGNPISSVYRGEIQGAGLGMALDAYNHEGQPCNKGEAGELVCTKPFPSMPVSFWNDPDQKKYKSAYFEEYENTWSHGDWVEKTEKNGFIIHGRSDATLNPGGVRIGTSEIYRQVEKIPDVLESIAVGQDWKKDTRILLFVKLQQDVHLNDDLKKLIKTTIRIGASPRHVPAIIMQVDDIPRTKSGKITEIAVRDVIHGRGFKNKESLANPEALKIYEDIKQTLNN